MHPIAPASAASRLCSECGLCCNGVLFHTVRLQPGDAPAALAALGLKLKRRKGQNYILQPCPAFCGSHCSIYAARPERCRLFECRQLQRVAGGEISEARALISIREVQRRVEEVHGLLHQAGPTKPTRPLSKRCEKVTAEPLDASSDPEQVALREQLLRAMRELDALLDTEFRIIRGAVDAKESMDSAVGGENQAVTMNEAPAPRRIAG